MHLGKLLAATVFAVAGTTLSAQAEEGRYVLMLKGNLCAPCRK
jgi:hypothetical protein